MNNIKLLQEQYRLALAAAHKVRAKYDGKLGDMNDAEKTEFDNALNDADRIQGLIESAQKELRLQQWGEEIKETVPVLAEKAQADGKTDEAKILQAWGLHFKSHVPGALTSDQMRIVNAYQSDALSGGGYAILPQVLANMILTKVKDLTFIRGMATVMTMDNADSLGVPVLDTEPSDSDWTTELLTGSEETTLALGKRELKPQPMAKLIKISNKLIRQNNVDLVSLILDRLAYKAAITEEKGFLTGTGVNQPLGVFTASASGVSTGQDVACASSTVIAADDLINAKHSIKAQYWPKAAWVFNRTLIKAIRKLKDSNNNYIWATGFGPGVGFQGNPETILDSPYCISEYAPNTMTTGLYVGMYADFSKYWIVDALNMQIQVLDQLYAATNQTGYILRKETDGAPVLEEAFARLKLA